MGSDREHKFNDDLLTADRDRTLAAKLFPELMHVLDFPELRRLFVSHDLRTNRAKRQRRRAGIAAILLGVAALLGASAEPLYRSSLGAGWPELIGGACALFGVASVLVGWIGIFNMSSKRRWLCGRLMTERLRQFHFQTFTCRMPEILASLSDQQARQRFLAARDAWFAQFRISYEERLEAKLQEVLADHAEDDFWLHSFEKLPPASGQGGSLDRIFAAYRLLRYEHQMQYAIYKLRETDALLSNSARRQFEILRGVGLGCILIVLAVHILIALSLLRSWLAPVDLDWLHVGVVWVAFAALTARALEEGLQPAREVERYTRYRAALTRLLAHFDVGDPEQKLAAMRETERLVYQEMRGFLQTNEEARFVL